MNRSIFHEMRNQLLTYYVHHCCKVTGP